MLITPLVALKSLAVNAAAPFVLPSAAASAIANVLSAVKSPPPVNGAVVLIVLPLVTGVNPSAVATVLFFQSFVALS